MKKCKGKQNACDYPKNILDDFAHISFSCVDMEKHTSLRIKRRLADFIQ